MAVGSTDKYEGAFKEAIQARSTAIAVTANRWSKVIKNRWWTWRKKIGYRRYTGGPIL